jgi:hypothetical protein
LSGDAWAVVAGCGAMVIACGIVSTGRWALATAERRAQAILTEPPAELASLDSDDLARLDEILARLRASSRPL